MEKTKDNKRKKVISQFLLAIIIGVGFETVYIAFGDWVFGALEDYLGEYIYYVYIIWVAAAGVLLLIRFNVRNPRILYAGLSAVAIVSGMCTEMLFFNHDTVLYYRLHGEFMPAIWDMGYGFFIVVLGVVYIPWIITVIGITIWKFRKRGLGGQDDNTTI
ncbi:hypothetical protein D6853_09710 [Butyrivibrio sp. X503]|uniref:hypothetical protein n=1 Tax=Butyrivibrio sp. X503 TaxID=2364878 RepID=UPI000EA84DDA|nr:hypothetical protein [Butyrivibrio sp. X503]RKM55812.1 hypothetical protein D6853_09710 [Butyrivibrio sp. X503]